MRKAGILLPIFSLASKYGIGSLGKEAYNFIDFLARTGQTIWQVLPITSTSADEYYSPYKTSGAFSGNPDFIDIDLLLEEALLSEEFVSSIPKDKYETDPRYIDYEKARALKEILLKEAFKNFKLLPTSSKKKYNKFCEENHFWLEEYCSYMSMKHINQNKAYWDWKIVKNFDELKSADEEILEEYKEIFNYNKFLQYKFYEQWDKLKEYANKNSVEIFGDMPIYISQDSSDFYFHREMFLTDENLEVSCIAGVPPDEFSSEGQCWGNPLYDWEYLKSTAYKWWVERIKKSFEVYDILRIDHFRAFESFYSIDKKTKNPKEGKWIKGPGKNFFNIVKNKVKNANIVAEDLGIITEDVRELLEYTTYPGMKVIQFGFNSDADNLNLPHRYYKNTVAYTGTHDNKTLAEWLETTFDGQREYAMKYLRLDSYDKYTEGFIRAVMASCSDTAIIPIQDWLDFAGWARINTPSTLEKNWKFRLLDGELTKEVENYITEITGLYGRFLKRK